MIVKHDWITNASNEISERINNTERPGPWFAKLSVARKWIHEVIVKHIPIEYEASTSHCSLCKFWGPFVDKDGRAECRRVRDIDSGMTLNLHPPNTGTHLIMLTTDPCFCCVQFEKYHE